MVPRGQLIIRGIPSGTERNVLLTTLRPLGIEEIESYFPSDFGNEGYCIAVAHQNRKVDEIAQAVSNTRMSEHALSATVLESNDGISNEVSNDEALDSSAVDSGSLPFEVVREIDRYNTTVGEYTLNADGKICRAGAGSMQAKIKPVNPLFIMSTSMSDLVDPRPAKRVLDSIGSTFTPLYRLIDFNDF